MKPATAFQKMRASRERARNLRQRAEIANYHEDYIGMMQRLDEAEAQAFRARYEESAAPPPAPDSFHELSEPAPAPGRSLLRRWWWV